MSRRLNADPVPLPSKPKYKSQFAVKPQENDHARETPLPDADETDAPAEKAVETEVIAPLEPVVPKPLGGWPPLPKHQQITPEESKAALALYHKNPGFCPYCKIPITRGVTGHLAKCLRLLKSKTGSTTIT